MHLPDFERRIGYTFKRRDLLTRAITHKSYSHEARHENVRHNETFEFLGDSVLGFVIGDMLFRHFPELDEGALSKMKAYLVSATSLAEKGRRLGMGDVILLGVGEEKTGGRRKDSLLASESLAQTLVKRPLKTGVVHRDLKPANIMITKSGAKLLGFGLAKPIPGSIAKWPHGASR